MEKEVKKPSPADIVQGMKNKFGEGFPEAIAYLEKLEPSALYTQSASSADSMGDPKSPFEPKFRTFIYLAAALAGDDQQCIKTQFHSALKQGATKEEIISIIKIVRHAASSGVYGKATYVLETLYNL
jgi:alkylhydroperoxidase/carboxymuconolactone decarboxylase family protein YurZ